MLHEVLLTDRWESRGQKLREVLLTDRWECRGQKLRCDTGMGLRGCEVWLFYQLVKCEQRKVNCNLRQNFWHSTEPNSALEVEDATTLY